MKQMNLIAICIFLFCNSVSPLSIINDTVHTIRVCLNLEKKFATHHMPIPVVGYDASLTIPPRIKNKIEYIKMNCSFFEIHPHAMLVLPDQLGEAIIQYQTYVKITAFKVLNDSKTEDEDNDLFYQTNCSQLELVITEKDKNLFFTVLNAAKPSDFLQIANLLTATDANIDLSYEPCKTKQIVSQS